MDNTQSVILLLIILAMTTACVSPQDFQNGTDNSSKLQGEDVLAANASPTRNLTVHFIDVGMGDSELIQTPSGRTMLIDAGSEDNGRIVAAYLKNLNIDTLDIVVASNPGNTNIGGMSEILHNFSVGEFLDSGDTHNPTPYYMPLISLIHKKNISSRAVKAGEFIALDPSITIKVLNPQARMSEDSPKNSVVLKIIHGNISFLFTGDIWGYTEDIVAETAGHADILKVADHGINMSTSSTFIQKVKPSISVIESSSDTSFGHRSPATIRRLQESGSRVFITDVNGTVKVTSDGNSYSVITEK